jgi:hypothetical protein
MAPGGGGHWGQANDPGWSGGTAPHPGSPQNPIYIPGLGIWSGSWYPFGTPKNAISAFLGWGGGNVPFPTPPIVIPPDMPDTLPDPDNRPIEWKTTWTQTTGWIVVGIPQGPAPTPS